MKLTSKNYDITGFEVSRLAKLLIILRISSLGDWQLQVGVKDGVVNLGKLWAQHRLKANNVVMSRMVGLLTRCLRAFRAQLVKFKRT